MMTKITVIIPLYYGKKYLDKILPMLQCNREQICEVADIELILVNDSPAEALSMDDVKGMYDFTIRILHNEQNRGIHYSRVHGLKYASGEYVLFLDQDDTITDNYFKSQLEHIKNIEDVVVANGVAEYGTYSKLLYRYSFMQWTVKHIWFYAKFDCRIISPGQCLIRRNSIPEIWTNNIMTKNGADDYFLWLVMLSHRKKFGVNREVLYTHRYTAVNVSGDKGKMCQSVGEALGFLEREIGSKYVKLIRKRIDGTGTSVIGKLLVRAVENINRK